MKGIIAQYINKLLEIIKKNDFEKILQTYGNKIKMIYEVDQSLIKLEKLKNENIYSHEEKIFFQEKNFFFLYQRIAENCKNYHLGFIDK